jgi:hypothetical protein
VVPLLYFKISFPNAPFPFGSLSLSLRHKEERTKMSAKCESTFTFENGTCKLECHKQQITQKRKGK